MGTENMKICIVSFTKKGYELSCDIAHKLEKSEYEVEVFTKCSRLSDENIKNSTDENFRNTLYISQNISDWTAAQMSEKKALIFIVIGPTQTVYIDGFRFTVPLVDTCFSCTESGIR